MQENKFLVWMLKFLNYCKMYYCINLKITIVNNQLLNVKANTVMSSQIPNRQ
jgi:hypothetical protein